MATVDRRGLSINPTLGIKAPCRAATTGDVALNGLQTLDGVALAEGDRVLVWLNADPTQNGPYNASAGNWTRALDADSNEEWANGMLVQITSGTIYGGALFRAVLTDPMVLETTPVAFVSAGHPVSVLSYGPAGNGNAAQDTATLQAFYNDPTTAVGYLPKGVYLLGAAGLLPTSNKYLVGDGIGQTTIRASVTPTLDMIYAAALTKFGFSGITFDGNGKLTSAGHFPNQQPCIHITGCDHFSIDKCEFIGFTSSGLICNVVHDFTIERSTFNRGAAATGPALGNYGMMIGQAPPPNDSYNFSIRNNTLTYCQISLNGHDWDVTGNRVSLWGFSAGINTQGYTYCYSGRIENNDVGPSNQAQDANGFYVSCIENWAPDTPIVGNHCTGGYGSGIDCGGARNSIIGNTCTNNGAGTPTGGIALHYQDATFNASGTVVDGNICTDTRAGGSRTQAYGLTEAASLTGVIIAPSNNFNGNVTAPMLLAATGRTTQMAATVTLDNASGFTGGVHQSMFSLSLANNGWQHAIASVGTASGNHTTSINHNNGDWTLSMNGNATFGGQFVISGGGAFTINIAGTTNLTIPAGVSTMVTTASNLGAFAATTSAQLAGVLSDETGSAGGGVAVFNNSPSITTPTIAGGNVNALAGLSLADSGFNLSLASGSSLTGNHTLTINTVNSDRTLTMSGNINVGGGFGTLGPITLPAVVQGDVWYGSAAGTVSALAKNTSASRYLANTGATNNPAWDQVDLTNGVKNVLPIANFTTGTPTGSKFVRDDGVLAVPAGGGNVTGPGSSTNLAIAKYSGAGGATLLNSGVTIDASNNVAGALDITWTGVAWTHTTPTVTSSAGAFTTVLCDMYAKVFGKLVVWHCAVTITTVNTASGRLIIPLPVTDSGVVGAGTANGLNGTTFKAVCGIAHFDAAGKMSCTLYDGTFPGTSGDIVYFGGTYETN